MIFTETKLAGAFIIDMERLSDERGFFARTGVRMSLPLMVFMSRLYRRAYHQTPSAVLCGVCTIKLPPTAKASLCAAQGGAFMM